MILLILLNTSEAPPEAYIMMGLGFALILFLIFRERLTGTRTVIRNRMQNPDVVTRLEAEKLHEENRKIGHNISLMDSSIVKEAQENVKQSVWANTEQNIYSEAKKNYSKKTGHEYKEETLKDTFLSDALKAQKWHEQKEIDKIKLTLSMSEEQLVQMIKAIEEKTGKKISEEEIQIMRKMYRL